MGLATCVAATLLVPILLGAQVMGQTTDAGTQDSSAEIGSARMSVYGYPVLRVNQDSIAQLLVDGRFDDLEQLFDSLEAATRADIRRELDLETSYRAFYGPDGSIRTRLDEWVTSAPGSDAALVARAQFHLARAWGARGEAVAARDLDGLRSAWEAGLRDAMGAVQLDPENLAAHVAVLRLVGFGGWSPEVEALVDQALVHFPTSYWIRFHALGIMEPRWGGSQELMRRFAADAQRHVAANPRLAVLLGFPLIDEASMLRLARGYEDALEALEDAREYGTDWHFFDVLGRTLYHGDRPREAVAALDTAIAILPVSATSFEYRALARLRLARSDAGQEDRMRNLELAIADLRDAERLRYPDAGISTRLADALSTRERCARSPDACFEPLSEPSHAPVSMPWWLAVLVLPVFPVLVYLAHSAGRGQAT